MIHHFPFDPRAVLGVSAEATPDEIRDAYREKSKKHHPDLGGDEWAFHMVARAYEVLRETSAVAAAPVAAPVSPRAWTPPGSFFAQSWFPFDFGVGVGDSVETVVEADVEADVESRAEPPGSFLRVEAELIWIRLATPAAAADAAEGTTLSVCMVVSWPLRSVASRAVEYAHLGDTLRRVIEAFDAARESGPLAARPRIEDGRFVGWLSFPDVPAARSAFLRLRDDLSRRGLTVGLETRDEIIPENWAG